MTNSTITAIIKIISVKFWIVGKMNETLYSTFRALRHRNYRLFFAGQFVSLTGTWIQQVALSWLIYSLTKSPLLMGLIMFAGSIPSLLVSPFAGVFIDRFNQYKVLVILQILFMIEAFIIAVLAMTGVIQVWHIVVLSILMGMTVAIDMPLRQAFVVQLIDASEDLGNAISLNSSCFNLARMVGPAIAGILIASFGEGICFLLNALSYIAVIYALLLMKIKVKSHRATTEKNMLNELKEGFKYAFDSIPIRNIIIYISIASLIGMSFPVLMPIYAKELLHGDAQTLGFLMSASGIGSLFGALYLAGKKSSLGLENWICIASLLFGFGLVALAFTGKILMAMALLFIIGFGMVVIIAACNTMIQDLVTDDKRGRVMSLYTMAFMGTAPIGSLCGGAVAQKIGVEHTFLLTGLTMLIAAIVFSTKLKYFKNA